LSCPEWIYFALLYLKPGGLFSKLIKGLYNCYLRSKIFYSFSYLNSKFKLIWWLSKQNYFYSAPFNRKPVKEKKRNIKEIIILTLLCSYLFYSRKSKHKSKKARKKKKKKSETETESSDSEQEDEASQWVEVCKGKHIANNNKEPNLLI
jgi:hypothetical protein